MLAYTVPVHFLQELSDCKAYLTGTHILYKHARALTSCSLYALRARFSKDVVIRIRKQRCEMPSLQSCARHPVVATVITRNMQSSKHRSHAVLALDH